MSIFLFPYSLHFSIFFLFLSFKLYTAILCLKYFFYNLGMKIGIVKDRVIFLVALETKPTRRNFWLKNRQNLKAMELYRSCQMGCIYSTKKKKMRWILPKACPSNVPTQEGQRKSSVFLASKKTLVGLIKSV